MQAKARYMTNLGLRLDLLRADHGPLKLRRTMYCRRTVRSTIGTIPRPHRKTQAERDLEVDSKSTSCSHSLYSTQTAKLAQSDTSSYTSRTSLEAVMR
jgi:hypothetical protein